MQDNVEVTSPATGVSKLQTGLFWTVAAQVAVILLVVLCVWPAMSSKPFTDDIFQLEKSSRITSWTGIFQPDAFNFFRPAKNAIFMLAAPFQRNLLVWHLIGLTAYLAASFGIYRIAMICLKSRRAALLTMAVWALSPSCASTAIWLSCANISIGIVFAAFVFHLHERAAERNVAITAGCVVFYMLSLFCYESLIAVPGLLFLRDLQQKRIKIDGGTIVRYGVYTLVAVGFLVLRHHFSAKSFGESDFHVSFAPGTKGYHLTLSAPWFLWRHFLMWVFPFGTIELLGSYGWMRSVSAGGLVFGGLFLVLLLALAGWTWRRFPKVSYGVLFFVVASIPAGNFLPGFNGPINDAYLTIPSIGLAMVFAVVCEKLYTEFRSRRGLAEAGGIVAAALLAILLLYRLPMCGAYYRSWAETWTSPVKLVLLMSETRPFQFQSKAYASVLLFENGYLDESESLANEVLKIAPWNAQAKLTLARIADFRRDIPLAESYYKAVLDTPHVMNRIKATALEEVAGMLGGIPGRSHEGAALCQKALDDNLGGRQAQIRIFLLLGRIYESQRNPEQARKTLERGLARFPEEPEMKSRLRSLSQ